MARTATLPIGFEEIDFKRYARNAITAQGRIRCWAMRLLQQGKTIEQAAEAVGGSRQSVHTWVKWLRKEGVERLVGKVRGRGRKGTRPRVVRQQQYLNAYLFGAVCPQHDKGAALALPYADTYAMNLHLQTISQAVAPNHHALVVVDGAGWL